MAPVVSTKTTTTLSRETGLGTSSLVPRGVHKPRIGPQPSPDCFDFRKQMPLGRGHSFSRIADTNGDFGALGGLPENAHHRYGQLTVTVASGMSYTDLAGRCLEQASRYRIWPPFPTSRSPGHAQLAPTVLAISTCSRGLRRRNGAGRRGRGPGRVEARSRSSSFVARWSLSVLSAS